VAFHKTSIAIDTQAVSPEEARRMAATTVFEVGQVHPSDPNIVWDGERWVPRAEWESRAVNEEQ